MPGKFRSEADPGDHRCRTRLFEVARLSGDGSTAPFQEILLFSTSEAEDTTHLYGRIPHLDTSLFVPLDDEFDPVQKMLGRELGKKSMLEVHEISGVPEGIRIDCTIRSEEISSRLHALLDSDEIIHIVEDEVVLQGTGSGFSEDAGCTSEMLYSVVQDVFRTDIYDPPDEDDPNRIHIFSDDTRFGCEDSLSSGEVQRLLCMKMNARIRALVGRFGADVDRKSCKTIFTRYRRSDVHTQYKRIRGLILYANNFAGFIADPVLYCRFTDSLRGYGSSVEILYSAHCNTESGLLNKIIVALAVIALFIDVMLDTAMGALRLRRPRNVYQACDSPFCCTGPGTHGIYAGRAVGVDQVSSIVSSISKGYDTAQVFFTADFRDDIIRLRNTLEIYVANDRNMSYGGPGNFHGRC